MRQKIVLTLSGLFLLALAAFPLLAPAGTVRRHSIAALLPASTATATPLPPATPTTVPTPAPPTPTPQPWRFAETSEVAGVPVGGLTAEEAQAAVAASFAELNRPLQIHAAKDSFTINAGDVLALPAIDTLVGQATRAGQQRPVKLPLHAQVNRQQILTRLEQERTKIEVPAATSVLSDAKALTQTFTFAVHPGLTLDLATAADQIATALTDSSVTSITLTTQVITPPRPQLSMLEQVLEQHAALWHGVAGLYVRDMQTGESIGYHADTVFSGASVMKVPIMIFAYARLGRLDYQQREWLRLVINESRNLEANDLLAAAVGGSTTDDALVGAGQMSDMLRNLGLKHTYMIIPYESGDYLIQNSKLPAGGPSQEGSPPFTDADGYVRTTPGEMGQLFVMLAQCSAGQGPLIEKYGEHLNAAVCKEMLDALRVPHDQSRMVAGLPAGIPVAHKGGWTEDFQSDVGIVDAPNGRYVAAIYIYRNAEDGFVSDADANPSPFLADFSHTIYTFFNPVLLDDAGHIVAEQAPQP